MKHCSGSEETLTLRQPPSLPVLQSVGPRPPGSCRVRNRGKAGSLRRAGSLVGRTEPWPWHLPGSGPSPVMTPHRASLCVLPELSRSADSKKKQMELSEGIQVGVSPEPPLPSTSTASTQRPHLRWASRAAAGHRERHLAGPGAGTKGLI